MKLTPPLAVVRATAARRASANNTARASQRCANVSLRRNASRGASHGASRGVVEAAEATHITIDRCVRAAAAAHRSAPHRERERERATGADVGAVRRLEQLRGAAPRSTSSTPPRTIAARPAQRRDPCGGDARVDDALCTARYARRMDATDDVEAQRRPRNKKLPAAATANSSAAAAMVVSVERRERGSDRRAWRRRRWRGPGAAPASTFRARRARRRQRPSRRWPAQRTSSRSTGAGRDTPRARTTRATHGTTAWTGAKATRDAVGRPRRRLLPPDFFRVEGGELRRRRRRRRRLQGALRRRRPRELRRAVRRRQRGPAKAPATTGSVFSRAVALHYSPRTCSSAPSGWSAIWSSFGPPRRRRARPTRCLRPPPRPRRRQTRFRIASAPYSPKRRRGASNVPGPGGTNRT